ncbi:hypothetical protein MU1_23670 [Paenibacillus glycanilyticus]|uniref:Uncharacterized protein n=1 Tax=Paenibacillus glycanilyticus TaxID=126569 RepID=A0ABQ6GBJ7_9BACL|nr:hypothetical protein MU1_23670 [Paenibacillus glycanilyticus]
MQGTSKYISHTSHFCVRKEQIEEFVIRIEQRRETILDDNDSDGYINIRFIHDHNLIQAQIGGSHEKNVYIVFLTNSSALFKFTAGLRKLLSYEDK